MEGLRDWLLELGLESYEDAVVEWARRAGAASLVEVAECADQLLNALPLKPLEAKRLQRSGVEVARRLLATGSQTQQQPQPPGANEPSGEPLPADGQAPKKKSGFQKKKQSLAAKGVLRRKAGSVELQQQPPAEDPTAMAAAPAPATAAVPACQRPAPAAPAQPRGSGEEVLKITASLPRKPRARAPRAPAGTDSGPPDVAVQRQEQESSEQDALRQPQMRQEARDRLEEQERAKQDALWQQSTDDVGTQERQTAWYWDPTPPPAGSSGSAPAPATATTSRGRGRGSGGGRAHRPSREEQPAWTSRDSWGGWQHDAGKELWQEHGRNEGAHHAVQNGAELASWGRGRDESGQKQRWRNAGKREGHHPEGFGGSSSSTARQPFGAKLRVDQAAGAGLSLLWSPRKGYRVTEVDAWPGQPDLRVGDLVRAIEGVRLDDADDEVEVERLFGARFRHGASLEVERPPPGVAANEGGGPAALAPAAFQTQLKVLKDVGCGLELVWHAPEGYLVQAIEPRPGQPSLQVGDVLRSVGGAPLGGLASELASERVMAEKLKDGVAIQAYRPRAEVTLGDLAVLPLPERGHAASGEPLLVPSVGIGTWSWGNESWGCGTWGPRDAEGAAADAFRAAVGRGCYFFDSAPTYGKGIAERTLGRLCGEGYYAVIATKHFPRAHDRDLTAAVAKTAREAIVRLQLGGPLDLLQLHKPADPPVSLEAQADALAAAVSAGLTRGVGVCNFSLVELRTVHERLRRAHGLRLSTCQLELSLLRQLPVASGMVAFCRAMGVLVLAYSPLGMGRLSGKYEPRSQRPRWGRHGNEARPFGASLDEDPAATAQLLNALWSTGQRYGGRTVAQVALNWVLTQGAVALAGARDRAQAEENAGAMGWRLSDADAAYLGSLGARGTTSDFQHG